jgi:hypothetical protein
MRAQRGGRLDACGEGGPVTTPDPDAALEALADALAPRLFERLKKLAADEAERNAEDTDALEFLEGLGWRREGRPNTGT